MTSRWTILACGDASRGDDGVAFVAVGRLGRDGAHGARVRRVGQLLPDDLVTALAEGPCVVVDAVHGIRPGDVVQMPLRRVAATGGPLPASSHALPIEIVIGLAEALGAVIDDGTFIGIGGEAFTLGPGLSPAAAYGATAGAAAIERLVRSEAS
jgi:hydrogenase maturation protease